jgi:cytochrome c oxidase subunit 2
MNDWIAFHIIGLPERASSNGKAIDDLIVYVHWLMLLLLVGWTLYFFYVLWRFNAKRNLKAEYEGSKSHLPKYVEVGVVVVEALLLLGLAIPLWARNVQQFPDPKDATVIAVMAQQFAWNALYPNPNLKDDQKNHFGRRDMSFISNGNIFGVDTNDVMNHGTVQVLNEIHVPVDRPVLIELSSKDVIHSFKLLAMRMTQDAIPGLRIPLTFTPTKIGRYQIECAQLCGNGHASMAGGFLVVQSQLDYDNWLKAKSGAATPASFE